MVPCTCQSQNCISYDIMYILYCIYYMHDLMPGFCIRKSSDELKLVPSFWYMLSFWDGKPWTSSVYDRSLIPYHSALQGTSNRPATTESSLTCFLAAAQRTAPATKPSRIWGNFAHPKAGWHVGSKCWLLHFTSLQKRDHIYLGFGSLPEKII